MGYRQRLTLTRVFVKKQETTPNLIVTKLITIVHITKMVVVPYVDDSLAFNQPLRTHDRGPHTANGLI